MKSAYLALARTNYWLVVIPTTGVAACLAIRSVTSLFSHYAILAVALASAAFLVLGGGALARRLRGQPLLPDPMNHGEWMLVFFMFWTAAFGHFLVGNVCLAIYQYRFVYPEREVEGGPLAFFCIIAAASYFLTLLMGEFGIRHDRRELQPRTNPSSGRIEPLSGNTLASSAADDTPR